MASDDTVPDLTSQLSQFKIGSGIDELQRLRDLGREVLTFDQLNPSRSPPYIDCEDYSPVLQRMISPSVKDGHDNFFFLPRGEKDDWDYCQRLLRRVPSSWPDQLEAIVQASFGLAFFHCEQDGSYSFCQRLRRLTYTKSSAFQKDDPKAFAVLHGVPGGEEIASVSGYSTQASLDMLSNKVACDMVEYLEEDILETAPKGKWTSKNSKQYYLSFAQKQLLAYYAMRYLPSLKPLTKEDTASLPAINITLSKKEPHQTCGEFVKKFEERFSLRVNIFNERGEKVR